MVEYAKHRLVQKANKKEYKKGNTTTMRNEVMLSDVLNSI